MRSCLLLLPLLFFLACHSKSTEQTENVKESKAELKVIDSVKVTSTEQTDQSVESTRVRKEYFVDSLTVGQKGKNKLEVSLFRAADSTFVTIDFFSLKQSGWVQKNHFYFLKDGITGLEPKLSDFNNDSHLDFTYQASIAARGSNFLQRLFIYDQRLDELILIKNSLNYPNLSYNKKLDCLNSFHFTGCSSQGFLKINKDSLIELAWIELRDGIKISEIDENGERVEILSDSTSNYECYTFFESYDPLIEGKY